jgi:hypothetical protein
MQMRVLQIPAESTQKRRGLSVLWAENKRSKEMTQEQIEMYWWETFDANYADNAKDIEQAFMKPELLIKGEGENTRVFIRLSASGYLDCTEWEWLREPADMVKWFETWVENY